MILPLFSSALIVIDAWSKGSGSRAPIYLADGPSPNTYGIAGYSWEPAVSDRPAISMDIGTPQVDGKIRAGRATFSIIKANVRSVDINALYLRSAPVRIYASMAEDLDLTKPEFDGRITSVRESEDGFTLFISAEVWTSDLEKPLLNSDFSGLGGINGDISLRGTLRPAGFGAKENIPPVWFDLTDNIGQIDGYGNTLAITRLMEGASDMGPRVDDYPTYAALKAAIVAKVIGPGQWGTCVAQGLVGLGSPPAGVITANATFGSNRIGQICRRIITTHAGVDVSRVDVAAFDAVDVALPYAVSYWTSSQRTVLDLFEKLALSAISTPLVTLQNRISISRAVTGAPVGTLDCSGAQEPRVTTSQTAELSAPYTAIKARSARPAAVLSIDQVFFIDDLIEVGVFEVDATYYAGNIVTMANGSRWLFISETPKAGSVPSDSNTDWQRLADAITAGNITYEDGTPVEALKPAEPGATDGMNDEERDEFEQLAADTAAAQSNIAAAQAQIAAIQSSVTADFSAVNQAVDALNLDVSGVRSDITSLEQQAAGIIASIGDVGVEVAQLTTDLATANSNIGINAQAITSVMGSVAQLSSTVQAHDASIITNAQAIGALGSDLAILTTRVTAGGPNLQPNGGLENGLVGMSYVAGAGWQVGSGPKSGQSVATFIAPANGDVSIGWPLVPMEGGIEITVSANMSFSADGGVAFLLVEAFDALGAHLGWSPERHQAASFDWSADESRRALTATTWTTPVGTASIRVYFVARPVGNMTFAGASQLMVQRGPHWSAFSSEASIVQSFQALSTLDSSYASLSTTVASHDGSIATLQQSYSGLNGTLAQLSSTVQAQDASIITLQQASSNQAGQLAQLSIDLAAANSNISINAQAISTTNSNVAQLSSTVQAQGALAATNAQAISALDSNLATLTTQVRAGSQPNLVVNGSGENGLANWTFSGAGWGSTVSGSWGSVILNYSLGASEQYSVADSDIFQVWAGDLTFALETVLTNSEGVGWARGELVWLDANQNALFTSFGPSRAANHDFTQDNSGRRALTWSIQVPSGAAFARARVVFYRPSGSITVAAFRQAKVEAGSFSSLYSSEASITQSFQALSTLNTQYASLSSTVSTQGVTITTNSSAITTLNGSVSALMGKWGFEIDVQGYVSGMVQNNNGQRAATIFRSDQFGVRPPGGTTDGYYIEFDGAGRTTQYIRSGNVRVVESGWLT